MRSRLLLLICLVVSCLVGCGESAYRAGLTRTNAYYRHLQTLDENLSSAFQFPPTGRTTVQVRAPKQFVLTQPDPPQLDADGYEIPPPEGQLSPLDQVQPYYLGIRLPGMAGAWSVQVMTDLGGADEPRPAFLYLMSNEILRQQQEAADRGEAAPPEVDPVNMIAAIEETLAGSLGVSIPAGDDGDPDDFNVRFLERYPRNAAMRQYHEQKTFTEIRFQPDGVVADFDVPYDFHLFEYEADQGETQVAFLLVAPQGVIRRENLPSRMDMMLATMKFARPRSGPPSGTF